MRALFREKHKIKIYSRKITLFYWHKRSAQIFFQIKNEMKEESLHDFIINIFSNKQYNGKNLYDYYFYKKLR